MENPTDNGRNWAGVRVAAAGMANNFACNSVFLGCKSEHGKGGQLYLRGIGGGGGERLVSIFERYIQQSERLISGSGGRVGVFARAKQEKEAKCS